MVSQCKLVSGWGLRKRRSAPPYGPCGSGGTFLTTYIYIAQVRRRKRRKCTRVHSCMSNGKVFSLFLNVSIAMSASCSSAGRLFQTRGPWTVERWNYARRILFSFMQHRVDWSLQSAYDDGCSMQTYVMITSFAWVVTEGWHLRF